MNNRFLCLSLLLLLSSCDKEMTTDYDGSTSLDEVIDYSSFKAEISDSFQQRVIATKATLNEHIGFTSSQVPELSVVFDDGTIVAYDYNMASKSYRATAECDGKAQYIYSTNEDVNGAVVAASFPTEFTAQPDKAIELKNRKSRVSISYKFDTTADESISAISVDNIYIGKVYDAGIFDTTNGLSYRADRSVDATDIYTTQVTTDNAILSDDELAENFQTASYQAFVTPQNLKAFDTYIKFDVTVNSESKTYTYYLPNTIYIEPLTLYKLVFEISYVDQALSFNLTSQSEVAEWEYGKDLDITVSPNRPVWSVWDGVSTEPIAKGTGTDSDPYLIENANQLAHFNTMSKSGNDYVEAMAAHYKIVSHIDWSNNIWAPVGSSSSPFTGVFDGNGYIIKGAKSTIDSNNNGMFCFVGTTNATTAAVIKNVTLLDCRFTGISNSAKYKQTGAIAGFVALNRNDIFHRIENCKIKNCVVSSGYYVGGIAGSGACDIVGCSVENTSITAYGTFAKTGVCCVGSIVGLVTANKELSISHNLSTNNTIKGEHSKSMAGIVGYLSTPAVTSLNISSNYLHNLTYTTGDGASIYAITSESAGGNLPSRIHSYHNMAAESQACDGNLYTSESGASLAALLNGGSEAALTEGDLYWVATDEESVPRTAYYSATEE